MIRDTLVLALALAAGTASAAPVATPFSYNFTATGFESSDGTPNPYISISGTGSYNPAFGYNLATGTLTDADPVIPPGSHSFPLEWGHLLGDPATNANGSVDLSSLELLLFFSPSDTSPAVCIGGAAVALPACAPGTGALANYGSLVSSTISFTIDGNPPPPPPVSEPGTLALALAGAAGMAVRLRRGRTTAR